MHPIELGWWFNFTIALFGVLFVAVVGLIFGVLFVAVVGIVVVSSFIRFSFLLVFGFPTVAERLYSTMPSQYRPPTGRSTWSNFGVCGSSKGFGRSAMVEMQRGRRAGYNSPIFGLIDGL